MKTQAPKFGLYPQATQWKLVVKVACDCIHTLMAINYLVVGIGGFSEEKHGYRYV